MDITILELSTISGGVSLGKNLFEFLGQIKSIVGADVVSAYFKFDCTRVAGSEKIVVELQKPEDTDNVAVWFYYVKPVEDYVFIRYPIVESCAHELVATIVGEKQPNAEIWRWIAPVLPGRIYGGGEQPPNLRVDFLVFGYKPKALIKFFSGS